MDRKQYYEFLIKRGCLFQNNILNYIVVAMILFTVKFL